MAGFDVSGSGGGVGSGDTTPTIQALGNLGATETIDMANETWVWATGTLDDNCAITVSNQAAGDRLTLFLEQDGTGGRTLSLNGANLAIPSAASAAIKVELEYTGDDWVDVAGGGGIQETVVNAKGDILAATAADTVTRLAVGTNGQVLTAASGQATGLQWADQAGGVTVARKSADETVNNSSTLQNDDHLSLSVAANETWAFDGVLLVTSVSTASDFKLGWTVPASTTMLWAMVSNANAHWLAATAGSSPGTLNTESSTPSAGGVAGTYGLLLRGVIRVAGTAGTVQFQWAQATLTAEDTKLLKDSHIVFRRLATS